MSLLLKTIEAFPRGRTTGQIFALLDVDFNPIKQQSIRRELNLLQQDELISLGRNGKWKAFSRLSLNLKTHESREGNQPKIETKLLVACPARFTTILSCETKEQEKTVDEFAPDPNALLRYYRSALQSDPRGALTQSGDRHGVTFQLLYGSGDIFTEGNEEGIIRIESDSLPDEFREALFRREANENALAIGWPIAIGRKSGAPAIRPVGLVAATWERSDGILSIHIMANDIMLNPDWSKATARGTAWSQKHLEEIFHGQAGAGVSRDEFLNRLKEAAARSVRGKLTGRNFVSSLDPQDEGIFDAIGLFLPTGSTFTAGAVRDLDVIASWTPEKIARTSLAKLVGLQHSGDFTLVDPINVGPLNQEQIHAVKNALSDPLSVVTGPPGTGKSQAIVAMVATAILDGKTVAVASKNHQALDAVQERLLGIAPLTPFMVRTLDPDKDIDQSVTSVIGNLVNDLTDAGGDFENPERLEALRDLSQRRLDAINVIQKIRDLNVRLADSIERVDLRRNRTSTQTEATQFEEQAGWFQRLLQFFRLKRYSPSIENRKKVEGRSLHELEKDISKDRATLSKLGKPEDPVMLTNEIQDLARPSLKAYLKKRCSLSEDQRIDLSNAHDNLAFAGEASLSRGLTELTLNYRPLWLVSVLGTPKRVPLFDGLFDLVIFDEASQCDIASALPLLARAKRAVIVGDDRQLAFIPQVGLAQDRNLMTAQGLPVSTMGRFAQGRKSLFDLARSTPGVPAVMFRDQYRSASGIVDYINRDFYGGKLRVSVDYSSLKVPNGAKGGLAWTDVPAPVSESRSTVNVNHAEIDAITDHIGALINDQGYDGSIGVISPFRPQVEALTRKLRERISTEQWENVDLRVATVDGFQGQEKDLILFSPVVHSLSTVSSITFLQRDWRRVNVAISRARAVAHVFGDLNYARSGAIKRLRSLAAQATEPRAKPSEGIFDSDWERIVYHALHKRGLDPKPQYEIAGRRLDFALFGANGVQLDLEVDGRRWHQNTDGNRKLDDHWRDHQMKSLGWKVQRFWVDELKKDMEGCLDLIERNLA